MTAPTFVFVATGMGAHLSGGDVTSIELARRLLQSGHRVILVTSVAGKRSCEAAGLKAEFWVFDTSEAEPRTLLGAAFHLVKRMIKAANFLRLTHMQEPTIVFPSSDMLNDVLAATFVRGTNIRWLALLHMVIPSPLKGYLGAFSSGRRRYGIDVRCGLNWIQQRASLTVMRRWYSMVIPQSPHNRRFLEKKLPRALIAPFNCPPGVANSNESAMITSRQKVYDACWLGRFHVQKGIPDLLGAWDIVRQERPTAKLALIGNVDRELSALIERLGVEESVICLGYLSGQEKFDALRSSRLFLFPSYYESWGFAIAEAMACGLPVVAYDLPVYRGIYPKGMLTAPVGNTQELAKCVLQLLQDDRLYTQLAEEARQAVSIYDWDRSVMSFVEATALAFAAPRDSRMGSR